MSYVSSIKCHCSRFPFSSPCPNLLYQQFHYNKAKKSVISRSRTVKAYAIAMPEMKEVLTSLDADSFDQPANGKALGFGLPSKKNGKNKSAAKNKRRGSPDSAKRDAVKEFLQFDKDDVKQSASPSEASSLHHMVMDAAERYLGGITQMIGGRNHEEQEEGEAEAEAGPQDHMEYEHGQSQVTDMLTVDPLMTISEVEKPAEVLQFAAAADAPAAATAADAPIVTAAAAVAASVATDLIAEGVSKVEVLEDEALDMLSASTDGDWGMEDSFADDDEIAVSKATETALQLADQCTMLASQLMTMQEAVGVMADKYESLMVDYEQSQTQVERLSTDLRTTRAALAMAESQATQGRWELEEATRRMSQASSEEFQYGGHANGTNTTEGNGDITVELGASLHAMQHRLQTVTVNHYVPTPLSGNGSAAADNGFHANGHSIYVNGNSSAAAEVAGRNLFEFGVAAGSSHGIYGNGSTATATAVADVKLVDESTSVALAGKVTSMLEEVLHSDLRDTEKRHMAKMLNDMMSLILV